MFKTILEALQRKFPGVDAKMLEPIAKKLAKTTAKEEDVATSVEGVTFQQVAESYSDFRVNEAVLTASTKAVSDYETKHNLKDGKPIEATKPQDQTKPADKPQEDEPEWARKLREQNETIMKRFTEQDESEKQGGFHNTLVSLLKEKGVRESFFTPVISGRQFKDEDEVKAYADTVEQSFKDDEQAKANADHSGDHKPSVSTGGGDEEDPLLKAAQEETDRIAAEKNKK